MTTNPDLTSPRERTVIAANLRPGMITSGGDRITGVRFVPVGLVDVSIVDADGNTDTVTCGQSYPWVVAR